MSVRSNLRNVAIVAHVDHGKTTLVDAMLRQAGAFDPRAQLEERVMDSGDLEREKGITILAKNTAIQYAGPAAQAAGHADGITINVIDTPGHADFGGEVERGLSMVDGVVLLVDSSEGPLPQTRFVLRKALAAKLPVILVVNKVDRSDARIEEVVSEATDLLLGLASDLAEEMDLDLESVLDVPVVYAAAKAGRASMEQPADGTLPDNDNLEPLFATIIEKIPAPTYDEATPLQAHVTNLDASPFLGRLALLRIHNGTIRKGQQVAWCRTDGSIQQVKVTELLETKGLDREPTESAGPGDIVAVAGIADIMIGETLADIDDPRPLPVITVDDPAISMTVGINTSPLAGKGGKGHKVTARQVKDRLDSELVGNVSLRVLPTERPDAWEVQGRGELALAILVEQMRREGFELTVGKPQVVTKKIDGKVHEPMERMTIDVPEEYLGAVTQLMAQRKGRMETMTNHGSGWVRMEFVVPARGLIGFRTRFLTETRGTGIASSIAEGYEPWAGPIETRNNGSLVADRAGAVTPFAMINLQERGTFFVDPTQEVYEGMVVGENSRSEDMDVNITKEKKLTNMRSSTADSFENLVPPRKLTLEECLEFAREDECVEITPEIIRIRKVILDATERARATARAKRA
ncbi:translational GTPase TypA [Jonesia denitrificans]|uniref:Large ribosomal subunit assembly factor BipA n=1 Tax=Jonesia denitrificans (strain ATCC 14870 / DSM 20603 / BCRC 15368 / CIP 55.134 / JCM 11481 / NBRC 15587 / NCTC 10816 / Prevot 55134) TaxID=471856 RepID=C7R1Y7_JONDD|nr:translational GTPase TypA [Jonesia denitrificans]ACV08455.1 GTP-binding protein TypA [Jonesia denitrificans DSM 20603]ASE07900.1 translational GTPase TypA [Jonesia denitrificans]QXB42509.1 translational GTPase TypA [Jonesia denitrificans]SQH20434.1 Tyrosine phosphorylated protein A [Jonesia denitrificans]